MSNEIQQNIGDLPDVNPMSEAEVKSWIDSVRNKTIGTALQQFRSNDLWTAASDFLTDVGTVTSIAAEVVFNSADAVIDVISAIVNVAGD